MRAGMPNALMTIGTQLPLLQIAKIDSCNPQRLAEVQDLIARKASLHLVHPAVCDT